MNSNKFTQPIELGPHDSDPSSVENGGAYYNSTTNKARIKENGVWVDYPTSTVFTAYQTAISNLMKSVAYINDIKASGTNGGTFTSGSFQTRTLNNLDDPMGIVTSLSANTFVLPAGRYILEGYATAYRVGAHKCKIRNVTLGTDLIIGSNGFSSNALLAVDLANTVSLFNGTIILATSTTLSLQHFGNVTQNTEGFGTAVSSGINELYSSIKITKLP